MTRSSRDKTNFKVGLFVISLFLVLSATAIFLAVQKRPVGSAQVFQLSTQSASGLTVGMPLFYSGFEVGELTSLTLTRAGTVQVESAFSDKTLEALRAKGHQVMRAKGAFGGYQGILIDRVNGVLHGATEARKDGAAVGY